MINKHFYSLLFLIICNATHAMEIETSKQPIIFMLPEEIHDSIFSYVISNWQHDTKAFQTAAALQLTCKKYAPMGKIAQWMNVNDTNKNILLMHAAQAGIPCLVTYAIAQKANLNYIQKPVGYTPLSCATRNNNYRCCEILLKAGADVNKCEEDEDKTDKEYLSICYMPIHLAVKNNNLKITKLLIDHKADINASTSYVSDWTLSMARNNKEMMILLLKNNSMIPQWVTPDLLKEAGRIKK
ncbi:MAG TPA: ankyrin repeat domain-containing protein [Candidatus Babeliales bacterium]|nr:ankyrin repeat domain-containing protein [Candidatus Babeliales bacterium]